MSSMKPSERMKIVRHDMPARDPEARGHDFGKVNLGFDPDLATAEALRCLACAKPTCSHGCPVGVNIKELVPEFRLPKEIVRQEVDTMRKMLIYRRSDAEMPARAEEVHHAREEGIRFMTLTNPIVFLGDEKGQLKAARCVRMELGEPDASGRRQSTAIPGSEFEIPLDLAIIAVGTSANPIAQSSTPGLATDRRGYIAADAETLRTSKRGVFAGGDIVTGAATVILAMGAGRKAAGSIDAYLRSGEWEM